MTEERLPAWTLVRAGHVAGRRFTEVFAAAGLTPTQFGVLRSLADGDGLTQAELARAVLVRPQSMGELVGSLVARGLVERAGPGGRGRRTGLALTAAGHDALAAAVPGVVAFNAPETLGLTAEQAVVLDDLLRTVLRALGEE